MNKAVAWVLAFVLLPVPVLASESIQLRADPETLSRLAAVDHKAAQLAVHYSRTNPALALQDVDCLRQV